MLASFLAGVIVHKIASSSRYRSRDQEVPGAKRGRKEEAHWRSDSCHHEFDQPGVIGRLLGQDG